jgi:hypothetical protein
MGLFLYICYYDLQKNKQCRAKDIGSISTPTMLFYMNFPEPNVAMQQKQSNIKQRNNQGQKAMGYEYK